MVAYGPNHLKFQSRNFVSVCPHISRDFVSVCPHMSRNFYSQNKFYILCIRSIKLNQFSPPPWHRSNWPSSPLGHQDARQGERGHGVALQRVYQITVDVRSVLKITFCKRKTKRSGLVLAMPKVVQALIILYLKCILLFDHDNFRYKCSIANPIS